MIQQRKHKINFQECISHCTQHLLKENYSLFLKETQSDLSFDSYVLLEYLNSLFSEFGFLIDYPGEIVIGESWLKARQAEYRELKGQYLDLTEEAFLALELLNMLSSDINKKIYSVEQQKNTIELKRNKKILKYA